MHARKAVLCTALAAGLPFLASLPALAATIVVTERKDVVADDGRCSLREAVDAANTGMPSGGTPGECVAGDDPPLIDVIRLRRAKYVLSLGAPGDDANRHGDLDVTQPVLIEGKGRGKTKIEARFGDPAVAGDGDRLFHVDPAGTGSFEVTFRNLSLGKGDVGCDGAGCTTGASAVEANGAGGLVFDGCDVSKNVATCAGAGCGDARHGAAIRMSGGGLVSIIRSQITKNRTACADPQCTAGVAAIAAFDEDGAASANFVLVDTTVAGNASGCLADGCTSAGILAIEGKDVELDRVRLEGNTVDCVGSACRAGHHLDVDAGTLALDGSQIAGGVSSCDGDDCATGNVVQVVAADSADVLETGVVGVDAFCDGAGCDVGDVIDLKTGELRLGYTELRDNALACAGDFCDTGAVLDFESAGAALVFNFDVIGNHAACHGDGCGTSELVEMSTGTRSLFLSFTSIGSNTAACEGEGCTVQRILDARVPSEIHIQASSVADNALLCEGAKCKLERMVELVAADVIGINGTALDSNTSTCTGAQCRAESILAVDADVARMEELRFTKNGSQCDGPSCGVGFGGALVNRARSLTIEETTFSGNRTDGVGAAVYNEPGKSLVLRRVKMRNNEAGMRATIPFGGLGGAICNGANGSSHGSVRVLHSVITGNRALLAGGGIANGGTLEVKGGKLMGNSPDDCFDGGEGVGCP